MAFLLPLVFVGVIVAIIMFDRREINARWSEAAGHLGLGVRPGNLLSGPAIQGDLAGVRVKVGVISHQNSNTTFIEVEHTPSGPRVTLRRQSALSVFGALIGRKDVIVGDPFFDDRVVVDSASPEAVAAFLTPARRAAVMDLFSIWPGAEITNHSIKVTERGIARNSRDLVGKIRRVADTALVMSDSARAELDQIMQHQFDGDLAQAAQELHAMNDTRPNVFTEVLEAEALLELGEHRQAAKILEHLDEQLPSDVSIDGWNHLAQTAPPPPVTRPAASVEPSVTAAGESGAAVPVPRDLRQDVVLDDLFAPSRMSWETVEHFEQTYRNATVEWTGTVSRSQKYQRDLDFGVGPGIKATVMIGHVGRSDAISNEIHAVVALPATATVGVGATIRVRGVLTNVDRFARKIWIQHAAVVA